MKYKYSQKDSIIGSGIQDPPVDIDSGPGDPGGNTESQEHRQFGDIPRMRAIASSALSMAFPGSSNAAADSRSKGVSTGPDSIHLRPVFGRHLLYQGYHPRLGGAISRVIGKTFVRCNGNINNDRAIPGL